MMVYKFDLYRCWLQQLTIIDTQLYSMNPSSIQQHEKTLQNMFSVHKFYLEVLEQMHKSLNMGQYMIKWDEQKCQLFIHAVKHYLNHQPDFFNKSIQKHTNNEILYVVPKKQKKRRKSSVSKSSVSKQSKTKKQKKEVKKQVQSQSQVNDLQLFNNSYHLKQDSAKQQCKSQIQEDNASIAPSSKDGSENLFFQDEKLENLSEDQEQTLGQFVERSILKTNALIFGNFSARQLRRKAKDDKIDLQLSNCFIKMFKNGRDVYYDRLNLNLFKIEKTDKMLQ